MRDRTREREEHPGAEERRRGNGRPLRVDGHGPPRRPSRGITPRLRPRPRGRVRTTIVRLIGLLATAVLLAVGVAVALMVTKDNPPDPPETFAAPSATPRPSARERARPRRPRLTPAQRASRDAAIKQLRSQGFEPVSLADYHPRQSLRVLIGRAKAETGIRGRRAFFFVRGDYLGTDAAEPSLRVRVARQRENQITLAYRLFAPGDKLCCPHAGTARVRFTITAGRLVPEDALPPVASRLPAS
jgi:hypothetical protein